MCIFICFSFFLNFLQNYKDIKIEQSGPCKENEDNAIQYDHYAVFKQSKNNYGITGNLNITRNLQENLIVRAGF